MANAYLLPFRQDASLARPKPFPVWQLTFGRWTAGDYGYNIGNTLFSSSVRSASFRIVYFSPGATGRTYGIIFTPPYSVPDTPNITYLWHSVYSTRTIPFRLAAMVCRPAKRGYLTHYLIAP